MTNHSPNCPGVPHRPDEAYALNDSVEADRIRDMRDAAIEEHRNGEAEEWTDEDEEHGKEVLAKHARMESLVKRLAAMDTTSNWPWQCAVASLIQEAKELTK